MKPEKNYYSKFELSSELGISIRTIDNWIALGAISYSKIGRRVIFSKADIENFIEKKRVESIDDINNLKTSFFR